MLEVKRLRQAREWNQTELAFHAGLAPSVISEIENGKRDPSARTLRKLARALEVEVADLFPKTEASLWPDEILAGRRFFDYRGCREALDRFCAYWEQELAEGPLDRRACGEFSVGAELTSKLLQELWAAERVELRIQRGDDPKLVDKSEPWPYGLMEKSELWPAIDRWMAIALQVDKEAKELFGEDAAVGAEVADLREYVRRKAS